MITFDELRAHAVTKSGVHYDYVMAFINRVEEEVMAETQESTASESETPVESIPQG